MHTLALDEALLRRMANAVRALSIDAVEAAKSGHPGMPLGMADAATVLFSQALTFDAADPAWPDRDRFVLSAGHGSMLLYALLHLTGVADVTLEEIKRFRQLGSKTPGHPEYGHTQGVETTTGPLGQGLANAVGMAMAEAHLRARFGPDLVNHRTWVIAGDGCLMEGISQEAIALAGVLRLHKLIVLWDDNDISIDGRVSLADVTDQRKRFEASGWATLGCDGHDLADVARALGQAMQADRPVMIACKTVIGFGAPNKAGTKSAHGEPLGPEEAAATKAALGWTAPAFSIPDDIAAAWGAVGAQGAAAHAAWRARVAAAGAHGQALMRALAGGDQKAAAEALASHAAALASEEPAMATRAASGAALSALWEALPELMGGSADLTGSNNTLVKGAQPFSAENPAGRYVHYGVREHAMAAAMNGMALHGGVIPYAGTFLCFADYARPAIRLAALMGVQVIHVMTHDSIGLGEDGPTHQPVEHLASLRAMPNVRVWRPCDGVETAECWAAALAHKSGPSVLALSRQSTPALRGAAGENQALRGGYVLRAPEGGAPPAVSLLASGTEVALAVAAQALLATQGVAAQVVSLPCLEVFLAQDEAYRASVLADGPRVAVEAGVGFGWERLLGARGAFVGMTGFGASAPAKDLYPHFGITAEAVAQAAVGLLA